MKKEHNKEKDMNKKIKIKIKIRWFTIYNSNISETKLQMLNEKKT